MVHKVIGLLYKEVRGLHQAAYVLAVFAFGSQLLALVRDRLLANQFGAGSELDIYYAAFRLPDLLFVVFAATLSVYVLIPFVAAATKDKQESGAKLLSQVFSVFLVVYVLVAGILMVLTPWIVAHLFSGIEDQSTLVTLTRILLVQPFLLGLSSLFGVVTQLGHRFVLYALSPLIYNLGIIGGIIFLEPHLGLAGLAWGVVLGAFGHMIIQWPLVMKSPLRFSFTKDIDYKEIRKILKISVPRAFTLSLNQLVLLVFVALASTLAAGSVSVFQFAFNLQSVPLAIVGVSYSVAAFPIMADLYAKGKIKLFNLHLETAIKHIIFWSLPIIALIVVLRAQIVRVVLGSGQFDWSDTKLTAAVLALLSISIVFQALTLLIVRAFYAAGQTRVALISAAIGFLAAIVSAFVLLKVFAASSQLSNFLNSVMRVDVVYGSEVLLLGVAYSVGAFAQVIFLIFYLNKNFSLSLRWLPGHVLKSLIAALGGAAFAYLTLQLLAPFIDYNTLLGMMLQGSAAGLVGLGAIVLIYFLLRSAELMEVIAALGRRLFKVKVVTSEEDII